VNSQSGGIARPPRFIRHLLLTAVAQLISL